MALDAEKPLKDHVDAFEKMLIDHALRRNGGNVSAVMAELALPRRTLNEKMAKYGLSGPTISEPAHAAPQLATS
jgi:DNA-binding NtrC family response regulator